MGKDTAWKEYFSDNRRYADLINGLGCGGKQTVTEYDLQELDPQTGFLRAPGLFQSNNVKKWKRDKGSVSGLTVARRTPRIRDMIRKAAFGVNFAVIGIENQEVTDYSIALRNLSYDTGEYEKQAAKIRRDVRRQTNGLRAGEYLYGFRKDSRLHPVITFILYAGEEEWDGPKSLHGMIDFTDIPQELRGMVPDYRINLIEIRRWKDTSVFQTDIRQVFEFIRYAEDKKALTELVELDPYYQEMEEDAYDVVTHYTHTEELVKRKDYYRKEGKVNMCTAIREMVQDGINEGLERGVAQGIDQNTRKIVRNMIDRGMAEEDIMAIAECEPELIREITAQRDADRIEKEKASRIFHWPKWPKKQ